MEIRQYLAVVRKWWWLLLLAPAVAAGLSWWMVKDQPPIYQTSTTLLIGQALDKVDPNYVDFYTSERLAQTYSELVRREPVLKGTAAQLGFGDQWRVLRGQISVSLIQGTQLLEIRVTDTDPQRAKLIADALATQLAALVAPAESDERQFIETQAAGFPAKIEAAQQEIQKLEAQLSQSFGAREVQDIQSQMTLLQSQITTWQATYAQYQLLLGERSPKGLEVIEHATVPNVPMGPNWIMQVVLAGAIGFILALAAVILVEYLDDTLKMPEDVLRTTGVTTLGAITRIAGSAPADRLITVRHPKSPISEAYRVVRTNLQFSSLDRPLQTIVVTSPNPQEGKSTSMSNLGVVMAQAGKKVVLVDSDLRRPMLHKIFGVSNKAGLTSALLQDEPDLGVLLQETTIPNLRVLTSGPLPPNPSELLGSQRMHRVIEELKRHADIILFDTPPALPVTDAAVLATQTDGALVVADAGRTRRAAARLTVENMRQVGAYVLGVIINRLSPRGSGRYYYYYYYYYYQQGSGGKGRRRRSQRQRWQRRILVAARVLLLLAVLASVLLLRSG